MGFWFLTVSVIKRRLTLDTYRERKKYREIHREREKRERNIEMKRWVKRYSADFCNYVYGIQNNSSIVFN